MKNVTNTTRFLASFFLKINMLAIFIVNHSNARVNSGNAGNRQAKANENAKFNDTSLISQKILDQRQLNTQWQSFKADKSFATLLADVESKGFKRIAGEHAQW